MEAAFQGSRQLDEVRRASEESSFELANLGRRKVGELSEFGLRQAALNPTLADGIGSDEKMGRQWRSSKRQTLHSAQRVTSSVALLEPPSAIAFSPPHELGVAFVRCSNCKTKIENRRPWNVTRVDTNCV